MFDFPRKHVGDRFNATMWMPRETGPIVVGILIAKIVEQQERIEIACITEAECTAKPDTGALNCRRRLRESFYRSNRHRVRAGPFPPVYRLRPPTCAIVKRNGA